MNKKGSSGDGHSMGVKVRHKCSSFGVEIPIITTLFPDGVICVESALDYYGYTNRTPAAGHLAVDFYINYPIAKPHFIKIGLYLLKGNK